MAEVATVAIAWAAGARDREVKAFGMKALELRDRLLIRRKVTLATLRGNSQSRMVSEARQELAYRLWIECLHLDLRDVATLIGRRDHTTAIHAILAGARANGVHVSRVSELRADQHDPVDWTKLAFHAAGAREQRGISLETIAAEAGIARAEWRKAERGRSVSAGTMLAICRHLALDPFDFLVTRETAVEHCEASS